MKRSLFGILNNDNSKSKIFDCRADISGTGTGNLIINNLLPIYKVLENQVFVIPENRENAVHGEFVLDGEVVINGRLVIA